MDESHSESGVAVESQGEERSQKPVADAGALAVSVDDFSALEQRVRRAVDMVKQERHARNAAEERAGNAEAALHAQETVMDQLKSELSAMRAERDQVRQRVERLLKQLDSLEL